MNVPLRNDMSSCAVYTEVEFFDDRDKRRETLQFYSGKKVCCVFVCAARLRLTDPIEELLDLTH